MKNDGRKINSKNLNDSGIDASRRNSQFYIHSRYIDHILPNELINICTVSFNQNECIRTLYESLKSTCKMPWRMHVVDNGSADSSIEELTDFCNKNRINLLTRKCRYTMSRASQAHGDALDFIVKSIGDDNSILSIVDSDFYFVKIGWDSIIRGLLPKGGHITTMRGLNVHKPAAFMSVFRKRYVKNKRISFMPIVGKTGKALEFRDVGYELGEIQMSKWQKLMNIPMSDSTYGITSVEGSCDISINGIPIASHLSRGRLVGRRREVHAQWADECRKYLNKTKK